MKPHGWMRGAWLLAALVLAPVAAAQQGGTVPVRLRVTSSRAPGEATIDRGKVDKIEVGDLVELRPRGGGIHRGVVTDVTDRAALVGLEDKTWRPGPGTSGEVMVPRARYEPAQTQSPAETQAPVQDPADTGDPDEAAPARPQWPTRDDGYQPGMPLLAGVRPQRPDQRPRRVSGTFYTLGAAASDFEGRSRESFLRSGVTLEVENPLGRGGRMRADVEGAWLTETNEQTGLDLSVRELSYGWGGDRFDADGFEVGRFLQGPMPEFGILDGVQWTRRIDESWRVGASAGFMPEAGEDMDTGKDLQFSGNVLWSPDSSERLTLGLGYQKSFNKGRSDRDLVVLRGDWRGENGWSSHGRISLDIHQGRDDVKGSGIGLTQAWVSVGRTRAKGGIDFTWRHQEFPEILRQGEFPPVLEEELRDGRYDRLGWDGWSASGEHGRIRGHLSVWNDEEATGGAGEFGVGTEEALGLDGYSELVVFGGLARFTDDIGVRLTNSQHHGQWRWNSLYEFGFHHLVDYPSDGDALFQHRLRGSLGYGSPGGWDGSMFAELVLQDGELAWSLGFFMQRSF